jgi:thioredoxin-related protein
MKTAIALLTLAAAGAAGLAAPAMAERRQESPKDKGDGKTPKPDDKKDDKPADKPDEKKDAKDAKKVVAGEWSTDYEAALADAKKQKKILVANFDAEWQEGCRKQKLEVFVKPEFIDWAKKHVILLKVEFPGPSQKPLSDELKKQNDMLSAKYKVEKYPTTVFINADGESIGTLGAVVGGPNPWTKRANEIIAAKGKK